MNSATDGNQQRDAASLRVLGTFFIILGGIVAAATFAALAQPHAAIVNAGSGLVLIAVGAGMFFLSKRMSAKS